MEPYAIVQASGKQFWIEENKFYDFDKLPLDRGDTFSLNFDYEGMLNYGLQITNQTNIFNLIKLLDSFEDVNYHREAAPLYDLIEHIKYQNEYGSNEVTRENIDESLYRFKRECEDTLRNIVGSPLKLTVRK